MSCHLDCQSCLSILTRSDSHCWGASPGTPLHIRVSTVTWHSKVYFKSRRINNSQNTWSSSSIARIKKDFLVLSLNLPESGLRSTWDYESESAYVTCVLLSLRCRGRQWRNIGRIWARSPIGWRPFGTCNLLTVVHPWVWCSKIDIRAIWRIPVTAPPGGVTVPMLRHWGRLHLADHGNLCRGDFSLLIEEYYPQKCS